jgi:hypothetical protein
MPVLAKKKRPLATITKKMTEGYETNYSLPPTLPNFRQTFTEEFNFEKGKEVKNAEIRRFIMKNSSF